MENDSQGLDYARQELDATLADGKRIRKELDLYDTFPRWKAVRVSGAIKAIRAWYHELHRRMAECEQKELDS